MARDNAADEGDPDDDPGNYARDADLAGRVVPAETSVAMTSYPWIQA